MDVAELLLNQGADTDVRALVSSCVFNAVACLVSVKFVSRSAEAAWSARENIERRGKGRNTVTSHNYKAKCASRNGTSFQEVFEY